MDVVERKMASSEVETPLKICLTVIEKKVRNLEKRKGKLDAYKEKATSGEELNKDQKEAVAKYDVVLQNLEFAHDLHKQFQAITNDVEKLQRKQAKREKVERQQVELVRLQELLQLQTLLDALGDDDVRRRLCRSTTTDLVITQDSLSLLDEFYQLITPSREGKYNVFRAKLLSAADHVQQYLERCDKVAVGTLTYAALHELIDKIDASQCLSQVTSNDDNTTQEQEQELTVEQTQRDDSVAVSIIEDLKVVEGPLLLPQSMALSSSCMFPVQCLPSVGPVQSSSGLPAPTTAPVAAPAHDSPSLVSGYQLLEDHWPTAVTTSSSIVNDVFESSSFFGPQLAFTATQQQQQQRPLQDIVSSMQGNFHFLQESEIDVDAQNISVSSGVVLNQFAHDTECSHGTGHTPSPHHFTSSSAPLYHQPTSYYASQHRASPAFSFTNTQLGASYLVGTANDGSYLANDTPVSGSYLNSVAGCEGVAGSEELCPEPIPLPSEVLHGQSLTAYDPLCCTSDKMAQFAVTGVNSNILTSVFEPPTVLSMSTNTTRNLHTTTQQQQQQLVTGPSNYHTSAQSFSAAVGSNGLHGDSLRTQRNTATPEASSDSDAGFITVSRSGSNYSGSRTAQQQQQPQRGGTAPRTGFRGGPVVGRGNGSSRGTGSGRGGGGRGGFNQRPYIAQHSTV